MKRLLQTWLIFLGITGLWPWTSAAPGSTGSQEVQPAVKSASPPSLGWHDPDLATGWITASDTLDGYGVMYKTVDGGQNWTRQGSPAEFPGVPLRGFDVVDARDVWVVGDSADDYGVILHTRNGGETWTRQGDKAHIPNSGLLRIFALDQQTAWASGEHGVILHTGNGGLTWNRQGASTIPDAHLEGIYASDASYVWVVGAFNNASGGLIFHSSNGGQNWEKQYETHDDTYLISIHGLDSDTAWAVGRNRVIHTTNGGESWEDQTPAELKINRDVNGVFALNYNRIWVVSDFGGIFLTTNGGADWIKKTTSYSGFYLLRISPIDAKSAWIVGPTQGFEDEGIILRTADSGNSWIEQHAPVTARWSEVSFVYQLFCYFPLATANN